MNELMESQGVGPEKLASLTNIPLRFINSLKNAEFSKLPSEPYVRGYLQKIAGALKTDPDEILRVYKESAAAATSGKGDKLPENRFRKLTIQSGWMTGLAIVILIASFLFFRFDDIFGITGLEAVIPSTSSSELIAITGNVKPGDRLTLNDEIVYTDDIGHFEKEIVLEPGLNKLEFKIRRFLGRERTIVRQIYYQQ